MLNFTIFLTYVSSSLKCIRNVKQKYEDNFYFTMFYKTKKKCSSYLTQTHSSGK